MTTNLEIARTVQPKPIGQIAQHLGLGQDDWVPYGRHAAKLSLEGVERRRSNKQGKLILVSAITPTPLGEGKTTTTVGLTQGLARIGAKAACTLRQPSLGPVFGIKGGGAGGGYSQVVPMELLNLHLTGDLHAVGAAHNLASAFLDNHLHHGNALGIDVGTVSWPRVVDMNDRALRKSVIGLGGKANLPAREEEWWITTASEVMAILALAESVRDLRARLGRIVVANKKGGGVVTLEELKVAGAMTALLAQALEPNLMQTVEGCPAFIHAGPFANIAHGCSSVVADRAALALADYVCTEAGFGMDMGGEKFFDIKCRQSGLRPAAAVIVATVRALKMHGGVGKIVAGKPLDPALVAENVEAVRKGGENLAKQIENARAFGVPVVVAINAFPTDTPAEYAAVREVALAAGAEDAVPSSHFARGGAGAEELARVVKRVVDRGDTQARLLYENDAPLRSKIESIATRIYGADGVDFAPEASAKLSEFERAGFGALAVCMAKTQYSISHDAKRKGRPSDFVLPVKDVRLLAGAGFVTVIAGDMTLMPGLPSSPAGASIDLDEQGQIVGLY
jgi:formate--tetrahydrofolate ligase